MTFLTSVSLPKLDTQASLILRKHSHFATKDCTALENATIWILYIITPLQRF